MNTRGYLEDDDLILYAMQALTPAESAKVAESLAKDEGMQERLAEITLTLGLYATASIDPVEPPAGSLERLMRGLSKGGDVVQMPAPATKLLSLWTRATTVLPRAGWAVAALLLLTTGWEFAQNRTLRHSIEVGSSQLQAAKQSTADLFRERDAFRNKAREATSSANASLAELSDRSTELSRQVDAASSRAEREGKRAAQLSARIDAEATRAARESARAADLATMAAENASERDQLQGALARQQDRLAQVGAQALEARQVLDALSDPTALHATLTVPKQKKTPSGRGTYVSNRGTLLFAGSNLPQLGGGKVYELWLMPADGSAPIPAGTFTPDTAGNATIVSTSFQKGIAAKGFAVTAEPAGGSQKPTLPILLAGL